MLRSFLIIFHIFLALSISLNLAIAQNEQKKDVVFVAPNTPLIAVARNDLNTERNKVGETILMQLASPVFSGSDLALPVGLILEAEITDIKKAHENDEIASMNLNIINILTHNGSRIPILARLNHDKLNLLSNKPGAYSKISPEDSSKPFIIKKGVRIPFLTSQTLRFENDFPIHKMIPKETNIQASLFSDKKIKVSFHSLILHKFIKEEMHLKTPQKYTQEKKTKILIFK